MVTYDFRIPGYQKHNFEKVLNAECDADKEEVIDNADKPTESEWEDIDDDGFVKVTNRRKKKNQRRKKKLNPGNIHIKEHFGYY